MLSRWVTLILCPTIHRILLGYSEHILVPKGLCQHRRRRNVGILTISLNYALKGYLKFSSETIAVNSLKLRLWVKP